MPASHTDGWLARVPLEQRLFWQRYWADAQRPLVVLLFLFPLVATYEFGAMLSGGAGAPAPKLLAQTLIQSLLSWFNVSGFWLPGLILFAALLFLHFHRRDPWRIRAWVLPLMAAESIVLTVPLVAMKVALLLAATRGATARAIIVGIGAGIYEELVFRLLLITGLMWLARRLVGLPDKTALLCVLFVAAIIFAVCHVQPVGGEEFAVLPFLFRCGAGAYLGLIFLTRGLGVATGCHVAYNLLLLLFQR
jgi:membrane protease YdiL (CAAX protease family)